MKANLHPQPGLARVLSVAERKRLQGMPDRLELRVSPAGASSHLIMFFWVQTASKRVF